MNDFLESIGLSSGFIMKILISIAIIIWVILLAKLISSLVGKLIWKAKFVKKAFKFIDVKLDMENIGQVVSKVLFYILLFVGIVWGLAFAGIVDQSSVNGLINDYLINFLNAAGLAVIAWFLAVLVKAGVTKWAKAFNLDEKLSEAKSEDVNLGETLGTVGYWSVIVFFLPQVLAKLGQEELLKPITSIVDNITAYIPNIVAAALIFVIGYFIAKIVKQIVTSLLLSVWADNATKKIGLEDFSISKLAGTLSYIVILLPVSIQALDKLQIDVISAPATKMLQTMMDSIPLLLTAGIIIIVSFFIGKFISKLLSELLSGIGFDKVLGLIGLKNVNSSVKPSSVVGTIVFSYILLLASVEAANSIGFTGISDIVNNIILFSTNILVWVVILAIGMYIANLVADMIKSASNSKVLPMIAKTAIIVLTGFMGLKQMGIGWDIIDQAFTLILWAMAVAFALSVGLGSKEIAGQEVKRIIENMKK